MRRVWIISDLQVPYHDKAAVDAVTQCITDMKAPEDQVISIGDEQDFQTISRWSQGTALEWERSIGRDRDLTVQILRDLQVDHVIRSNHTDRLFHSLMKRLPGLIGLPELEIENFLRFPDLGITFHKAGYRFAPGWIALHGDEGGLSQVAGATSAALCRKTGLSVVCGHSHRLGLQPHTTSIQGKATGTLFGFEVGNLMDMRKALYAKTHNWQSGFGLLYVEGNRVIPNPVPIVNRSFVVEGQVYSW